MVDRTTLGRDSEMGEDTGVSGKVCSWQLQKLASLLLSTGKGPIQKTRWRVCGTKTHQEHTVGWLCDIRDPGGGGGVRT